MWARHWPFSRQVCAFVTKVRSRDVTVSRETRRGEGHVMGVERLTWAMSIGALIFPIYRYIYIDLRSSVIYYNCNKL